jgi:hypothetical protein
MLITQKQRTVAGRRSQQNNATMVGSLLAKVPSRRHFCPDDHETRQVALGMYFSGASKFSL